MSDMAAAISTQCRGSDCKQKRELTNHLATGFIPNKTRPGDSTNIALIAISTALYIITGRPIQFQVISGIGKAKEQLLRENPVRLYGGPQIAN